MRIPSTIMQIAERYSWLVSLSDGTKIVRSDPDFPEKWKALDKAKVESAVFVPAAPGCPVHHYAIDRAGGEVLANIFGTGFMSIASGEAVGRPKGYFYCVQTNQKRLYINALTGGVIVTKPDFVLNI